MADGRIIVSALQCMEVVAANAHEAGAGTDAGCSSGAAALGSSHGHRVCSALGIYLRGIDESRGIFSTGNLGSHGAPWVETLHSSEEKLASAGIDCYWIVQEIVFLKLHIPVEATIPWQNKWEVKPCNITLNKASIPGPKIAHLTTISE